MKSKIGFLTIGQSPRPDVLAEIEPLLGRPMSIVEAGALDYLSSSEIDALRPTTSDFPLVTRLRDGRSVVVSRKKIVPLLQRRLNTLKKAGVDVLALLCTEEFPELVSSRILLQPGRILRHFVSSLLDRGLLFVFVPLSEQKMMAAQKWRRRGLSIHVRALSPYAEKMTLAAALRQMEASSPDLIILDCIGYGAAWKERIQRAMRRPVLSPREALAAAIRMVT